MKTSNKLLIAFAVALILIPALGMVYVSATQYKTGNYQDQIDAVHQTEKFNVPNTNMKSVALSAAFKSVNVNNAKGISLNIQLVSDEQFGVKISNDYKDLISAVLDANGHLQLSVKEPKKNGENRMRNYAIIYIYAPHLTSLIVSNANNLIVKSISDSLELKLNKIEAFYFNDGTQLKQLNLDAKLVKDLTLRKDDIKSVTAVITDTKFAIETMSLDNVNLTTTGNSKIEVYKYEDDKKAQIIKNLVLNTNGIAEVKFENTIINNCSGKFSDQTQVQMPAVNLNQMYRNK